MITLYLFLLFLLGIFSFSQIDLNLTLFSNAQFINFQKNLIYLGYYQRSFSTVIFISLTLTLMLFSYFLIKTGESLSIKKILAIICALAVLGIFAYPAFSHDIFNYIFDAKILMYYGADPYITTPLMFKDDSWTRFMHWTHRTYPYGPLFLPISALFYALGFGKFTLTLLSFKVLMTASYCFTCWIIYRWKGKSALLFFASNPLIIYETLIAGHLDILMLLFMLLSLYLWQVKKHTISLVLFLASIGIKYMSIVLLPLYILKIDKKWYGISVLLLTFMGTLIQIANREFLPHYWIVFFGVCSIFVTQIKLRAILLVISIIMLLIRYIPFIYTGQWETLKII